MNRYRKPARILHWITAALILAMIPAGIVMTQDNAPFGDALFLFHKNTGVIVLALMLARLAYRWLHQPPPLPLPAWQVRVANTTHWLLYATVLVMAVSGYIRVTTGGFPLEMLDLIGLPRPAKAEDIANAAKAVHWATHYLLIALVALHIGAGLMHWIRRDGIMSRML